MNAQHAQHTPGPWTIEQVISGQWVKSGESYIVTVPDHIEHEGLPVGSIASQDKTQAEIDANARLISAAPELLASLENCLASLEYWFPRWGDAEGVNSGMMKSARAAISKAKGVAA